MKKRCICLFLMFSLMVGCFAGVNLQEKTVGAASNIYFAGYYKKVKKCNGYSQYYSLDMQQYSSPEKNKKGNFTLQQESDYRINDMINGELRKVEKNKYRYKKKKVTITFKVYKKKVVIKQKGKSKDINTNYSGTYKKIKAYERP